MRSPSSRSVVHRCCGFAPPRSQPATLTRLPVCARALGRRPPCKLASAGKSFALARLSPTISRHRTRARRNRSGRRRHSRRRRRRLKKARYASFRFGCGRSMRLSARVCADAPVCAQVPRARVHSAPARQLNFNARRRSQCRESPSPSVS